MRHLVLLLILFAPTLSIAQSVGPNTHPRILIKAEDLPRIRHWCGVQRDPREPDETYGSYRLDYHAVRNYFRTPLGDQALPGEIMAVAFLHLIEPDDPEGTRRMAWLNRRLTYPDWTTMNPLELAVAMDWCSDAISSASRRSLLLAAEQIEVSLSEEISPFSSRNFDHALFSLALAAAVDPQDEPSRSWIARRGRLIDAGSNYARRVLPKLLACRTPTPTSPATAALEEYRIGMLLEVLSAATRRDQWARHATTLRRWMEHYVVARPPNADPPLLFIRDDGNGSGIHPAAQLTGLQPLVAHLYAMRTRSEAAHTVAQRVTKHLQNPPAGSRVGCWRWVPAALGCVGCESINEAQLPSARNLGGSVILRGMIAGKETRIWIDAGTPRLRPGQHFDAGHFLIYRGGYQTVMAADDVAPFTRESSGGRQRLGGTRSGFDFEQFQMSGIAHNCMVFEDPAYRPARYGREFLPSNGQYLTESSCVGTDDANQDRILSFSSQPGAAYVALDLTESFDRNLVRTYTREFFWLDERFLVIADRWRCPHGRVTPTATIQLPVQPTVDGVQLASGAQSTEGVNAAGIWYQPIDTLVTWNSGSGAVAARFIQPGAHELRIVGGPAERLNTAPDGRSGISYVGGSAGSFERLIHPADRTQKSNAWFRIGEITTLGPAVGVMGRWGRIEFETLRGDEPQQLFTILAVHDSGPVGLPEIASSRDGEQTYIRIAHEQSEVTLRLPSGLRRGGLVRVRSKGLSWTVPEHVIGDAPFKTLSE